MTNLLNPRRTPHQLLALLLAATMALSPVMAIAQQPAAPSPVQINPSQPPLTATPSSDATLLAASTTSPQPIELSYVVPNSCVLLALRPAQLLTSPMAELYPTEVLQAAGLTHTGLDPLAAEHVVLAVAPTLGGPPSYSIFTRFNKPSELKLAAIPPQLAPGEVAGKQYLQSKDPMVPSIVALDAQSLLVAPDYFLRNLVQAQQAQKAPAVNNFAAAFAAADQGDDLLLMVDFQPLRALINIATSQAPIPPELTSVKRLPNLVRFLELRANFSRPAASSLVITANNEADAEQIITISNEMKQLVAAKWAMEAQKLLASEDPIEQASGRYSLRMSRLLDERLQLQREGANLIVFRDSLKDQGGNPMVTTATIGVLVALLLPAVQAAREAARRNHSMNNLKQIMLALLNHESARGELPAYANVDAAGKPLLSWRVHLLPYLEGVADGHELYKRFKLDEPWDSEHNKALIPLMPELYLHPGSKLSLAEGKTNYLGVYGDDYLFSTKPGGRKLRQITDGTSNTIAVVQATDDSAVIWTKPADFAPDNDNPAKGLGGLAGDIFLAGYIDGHVTAVHKMIDAKALRALFTIGGGEVTPNGF